MSKVFPTIQVKPVASGGTPEFQALRDSIAQEQFTSIVPPSLLLPPSLLANPPKNITTIPTTCGLLTPTELAITTTHDATSLAAAIASRQLTAVAVATAFTKRAILAHQLTTCLTEYFPAEALATAAALDAYQAAHNGATIGPLHGVPVSIKEHMRLAGHFSSTGYLGSRQRDTSDALVVAILRNAGAVFYCKTTQPQGIMHLETVSPASGRTLNPHHIGLSAGGSSGGEAALLALRGSVLGLGSDIGGSIRGPAAFCGVYGFKPSSCYLPVQGLTRGGFPAELTVLATCGPMAVSLRDLDLLMRVVLAERPYLREPSLVPIPWTGLGTQRGGRMVKVGVMMHDGAIHPQPPVTRALEWAKAQLSGAGAAGKFEVKPFQPFRAAEAIKNIRRAYWPDGGAGLKAGLAKTGEPIEPLTEWIIKDVEGKMNSWEDMFTLRLERDEFRAEFAAHWEQQDVDVVVTPVFVGPASAHDTAFYWNYTAFFNYVDCPGVVVPTPVKALRKGEETYASGEVLSEEDAHVRRLWEEGDFEGAPIALQIVARKYHDNELFAAVEAMKDVLELGKPVVYS